MKKILLVVFAISIVLNIYLTRQYLIDKKKILTYLYDVKPVDKLTGLKDFEDKLADSNVFETKKYFLIQTWDTLTCDFEGKYAYMKALDSIADNYKKYDLGFIFISEMDDESIEKYCKIHNMHFKNFIYINDANDFISSIFFQKKIKYKKHPAQFIMSKIGDIVYYKNTKFTDVTKDSLLISNLNKFN